MELIGQIEDQYRAQLRHAAALPEGICIGFDAAEEESAPQGPAMAEGVLKTSRRTVVTLHYGRFQVKETVRRAVPGSGGSPCRSARLARLVPPKACYAFDVLAYVGVESFLHGKGLEDLQRDLAHRQPAVEIPLSSLWDQAQKFLFYLGHLHRRATERLRTYLADHTPVTWLLDGTCEPGTAVFLGIQHAASGVMLCGRKIGSENTQDIAPCLHVTAQRYRRPDRVLHDLSHTMIAACEQALADVPHFVCHFHLAQDVGEDLYRQPQAALSQRLRALKLQLRLHEQRHTQTQWLRQHPERAHFVLDCLLQGQPVEVPFDQTLGREVLLAFHVWILDYPSDGRRQGFPFDPYLLYLHRRLVRASQAVDRLLAAGEVARQAPSPLFHLQKQLRQYCEDKEIRTAAERYEQAWAMFHSLRQALRMSAEGNAGLHEPYCLAAAEHKGLQADLAQLRGELRQQQAQQEHPNAPLARIVLKHLDKYWTHLLPEHPWPEEPTIERTTNKLEKHWGGQKRRRRKTHGRRKLTRDFQSLPEEYLLVPNLDNPVYVELVLDGNLETLPSKLAEASQEAGTFDAWRRERHPHVLGHLPRRTLRENNFLDHLLAVCETHCHSSQIANA